MFRLSRSVKKAFDMERPDGSFYIGTSSFGDCHLTPVQLILPVRNEEANLNACVATLLAQDYPDFDLTIIDDDSTDATPHQLAELSARDPRIQVHRVDQLPAGWAGKPHALHIGATHTA